MQTMYHKTDSLLHRLNPLSKVLAPLPVIIFVVLTTDPWIPLAFFGLATFTILVLGRIPLQRFVRFAGPFMLFAFSFLLFYPLIVRAELVAHSPVFARIGSLTIYQAGLLYGLATALRIATLLLLSLLFTFTTDSSDFIRALVQQWKVPYKLGYSALAAFRFVPMLQSDLRIIQAAHKIRGIPDRGGLRVQYDRARRYIIPLLATAIRQAERTALAMDGRAFGAFTDRTYYKRFSFKGRDYSFIGGFWLASVLLVAMIWWAGLLGPLVFLQP
jgi:energy-coupling factor transport system permease protein